MDRRCIHLRFNQAARTIRADGSDSGVGDEPEIFLAESVVFNCEFVRVEERDGERVCLPVELNAAAVNIRVEAYEMNRGELLFAGNSGQDSVVNAVGDWEPSAAAQPADGQVSFRISTANAAFCRALRQAEDNDFRLFVAVYADGDTAPAVLGMTAFGGIDSLWIDAEALPEPETVGDTQARLAALLAAAPEMRYWCVRHRAWESVGVGDRPLTAWRRSRCGGMPTSPVLLPRFGGPMIDFCAPASAAPTLAARLGRGDCTLLDCDTGDLHWQNTTGWHNLGSFETWPESEIRRDLVFQPSFVDGYRRFGRLDAVSDRLESIAPVRNATTITLRLRSANVLVSGNAVLSASVGETSVGHCVVAVTGSETKVELTLPASASGLLRLSRDCADAEDTLADGSCVSLELTGIRTDGEDGMLPEWSDLAADPACLLAVYPDNRASWISPIQSAGPQLDPTPRNFAAESATWYEWAVNAISDTGDFDLELAFLANGFEAGKEIFGVNGQQYRIGIIPLDNTGAVFNIRNVVFVGLSGQNMTLNLQTGIIYRVRFLRMGNIARVLLDGTVIQEFVSAGEKLPPVDWALVNRTRFNGTVISMQYTGATSGKWRYPSIPEHYRLLTLNNVRTDRGVFEAANHSLGWSIQTALTGVNGTVLANINGNTVSNPSQFNKTTGLFAGASTDVLYWLLAFSDTWDSEKISFYTGGAA